jgi:ATP-dependent DNA helicase 2 subunit 1
VFTGSRKLFAALLDRCIVRKVVPVCYFTPNTNAFPSLVALIPQEEQLDESNTQILPPGFHVVYLPYTGKYCTFSYIRNIYFEVYDYFRHPRKETS